MTIKKNPGQVKAIALLSDDSTFNMLYGSSRSGKSFICSYALFVRAFKHPGSRHAIIRKYLSSVRRSMWDDTLKVLMKLKFEGVKFKLNNQDLTIVLPNLSEICLFGLDDKQRADRILGLEFSTILFEECSELTYDSVQVATTRLAQKNELKKKIYCTQNPTVKSHWSYKTFVMSEDPVDGHQLDPSMYSYLKMTTEDNIDNIDATYIRTLASLPINQRKRFAEGDFQDDVLGALFRQLWIEKSRYKGTIEDLSMDKVIISLDPSGSSTETSDECGIVVAGKDKDGFYILDDQTNKLSPAQWAAKAVELYYKHDANYILAETNFGADMVEICIHAVDKFIPVKTCRASKGKLIRAEPVSGLYERNLVHHVGIYPELELEMTSYLGEGKSPNRLDALVWAINDLSDQKHFIKPSISSYEEPKKEPGIIKQPVHAYEEDDRSMKELIEDESLWTEL